MNTKGPIPLYIGITDFSQASQVRAMANLIPPDHRRSVMTGFMMSYKVFNDIPSKWKDSWINPKELARVCIDHPKAFPTLHWADYEGLTTIEDIFLVCQNCGAHLKALQLDMIWPEPSLLKDIFSLINVPMILQIGTNAFDAIGNDPIRMMNELNKRIEIEGVLLDRSMGRGLSMYIQSFRPFLKLLFKERPGFRVAVAGGLGPDSLGIIKPLMEEFPDLSIDAQGRLRPSGDAHDPIDWEMATEYLCKSLVMFP